MSINFFYDPHGGALCQNANGLVFYLQGQPPTRPQPSRVEAPKRPVYPGQAPARGFQHGWTSEAPRG